MRTENAEMIKLEWIVAETEIKQILESRLVPESDLQSAGKYWGTETVKLSGFVSLD